MKIEGAESEAEEEWDDDVDDLGMLSYHAPRAHRHRMPPYYDIGE